MRFGLDVDGVIYEFQKTAIYMLNSMRGYSLNVQDWAYWNWPKDHVKNNDWQWLWSKGVELGLFRYGHLYRGSIEGIRSLGRLGDVVVITHRPRSASTDTLDWLAYLKLPIHEVHLLTDGSAKSAIKCDLYVDDKTENAFDFMNNTDGVPLLWTRPWNSQAELGGYGTHSIMRVSSWEEVVGYAKRISS